VITPYLIIPFAGLYRGYFLLILLAILSGLYLLLRDSRLKRGFRLGFSILAITVYLSLVLLLPERHLFRIRQEMIRNGLISGIREGSTGTVKIYRQAGASSLISLNGKEHYSTDEPGLKTQLMPAFLPVILNNDIRTALVSGFGTGITAWSLASCEIPSIHITDFNPEMIKLAAYAFSDLNDDVLTASGVDITLEDVRTYLFRAGSKLDLITTGASHVGSFPHLYTSDFYKICLDKISDKGYLSQVILPGRFPA
jgi:predicted membrane-bound spermidine synthase